MPSETEKYRLVIRHGRREFAIVADLPYELAKDRVADGAHSALREFYRVPRFAVEPSPDDGGLFEFVVRDTEKDLIVLGTQSKEAAETAVGQYERAARKASRQAG